MLFLSIIEHRSSYQEKHLGSLFKRRVMSALMHHQESN